MPTDAGLMSWTPPLQSSKSWWMNSIKQCSAKQKNSSRRAATGKVLEKLREHEYARFLQELLRKEQRELDDIGATRFVHRGGVFFVKRWFLAILFLVIAAVTSVGVLQTTGVIDPAAFSDKANRIHPALAPHLEPTELAGKRNNGCRRPWQNWAR